MRFASTTMACLVLSGAVAFADEREHPLFQEASEQETVGQLRSEIRFLMERLERLERELSKRTEVRFSYDRLFEERTTTTVPIESTPIEKLAERTYHTDPTPYGMVVKIGRSGVAAWQLPTESKRVSRGARGDINQGMMIDAIEHQRRWDDRVSPNLMAPSVRPFWQL